MDKKHIYIVRCTKTNLFKIGLSKTVKSRMRQIVQSKNVEPISFEDLDIEGMITLECPSVLSRSLESMLHYFYAHKRKTGEWFQLNQEDLEQIKSYFDSICIGELFVCGLNIGKGMPKSKYPERKDNTRLIRIPVRILDQLKIFKKITGVPFTKVFDQAVDDWISENPIPSEWKPINRKTKGIILA